MNKAIGLVLMTGFWLAALASAGALFYAEVLTRDHPYQKIVEDAAVLPAAQQEWSLVTVLLSATMIFASLAWLMYVKTMEKPSGQESVILGIKSED